MACLASRRQRPQRCFGQADHRRRDSGDEEAVIRFQRATHLKPDGLWGPGSQAALDKMLHRKPSKPARPLGWIRNLQRDLTTLLYSRPITGVGNDATRAAIIRFQRAAHLKPDGLRGAKSRARQEAAPRVTD
jgi:peptidoglycan hydrolase-like protein with peptidoglycan-binding domain